LRAFLEARDRGAATPESGAPLRFRRTDR
jgi:hypothetical protein